MVTPTGYRPELSVVSRLALRVDRRTTIQRAATVIAQFVNCAKEYRLGSECKSVRRGPQLIFLRRAPFASREAVTYDTGRACFG